MKIPINELLKRVFHGVDQYMAPRESELRSDYDLTYCSVSVVLGLVASYAANQIPNFAEIHVAVKNRQRQDVERAIQELGETNIEIEIPDQRSELSSVVQAALADSTADPQAMSAALIDAVFSRDF